MQIITSTIKTSLITILIASTALVGCKPPLGSSGLTEENSGDAVPGSTWPYILQLDASGSIRLAPPKDTSAKAYLSSIELKPVKEDAEISADKEHYTKPLTFLNIKVVDPDKNLIAFSKGEILLGSPANGSSLTYQQACEFEERGEYNEIGTKCTCKNKKDAISVANFLKFDKPMAVCSKNDNKPVSTSSSTSSQTTADEKLAEAFKISCEKYNTPLMLPIDKVEYYLATGDCRCSNYYLSVDPVKRVTFAEYKNLGSMRDQLLYSKITALNCSASENPTVEGPTEENPDPTFN